MSLTYPLRIDIPGPAGASLTLTVAGPLPRAEELPDGDAQREFLLLIACGVMPALVRSGRERDVEDLMTAGAEVDWEDEWHGNLLTLAVGAKRFSIVKRLLDAGVSPDQRDGDGVLPLCEAIAQAVDDNGAMARLLLAGGAGIDGDPEAGRTPLEQAAFYGEEEIADELLKRGASALAPGTEGSLLAIAAREDNSGIVALLLDAGADLGDLDDVRIGEDTAELLRTRASRL